MNNIIERPFVYQADKTGAPNAVMDIIKRLETIIEFDKLFRDCDSPWPDVPSTCLFLSGVRSPSECNVLNIITYVLPALTVTSTNDAGALKGFRLILYYSRYLYPFGRHRNPVKRVQKYNPREQ